MDKEIQRTFGEMRPPPLFRSIGPPGPSASRPPRRRLRSLFRRSRAAVLPTNTQPRQASVIHPFNDIQTGANVLPCPLTHNDFECNTVLNAQEFHPEANSNSRMHTALKSGVLADTLSLITTCPPQTQSRQEDRRRFPRLCPSPKSHGKSRGRRGRVVSPPPTSEEPTAESSVTMTDEQQKRRKRRRRRGVDCKRKRL